MRFCLSTLISLGASLGSIFGALAVTPSAHAAQISACQYAGASNQRCCTPDLNPTWWCSAPSILTGAANACTVTASSGSTTGTLFTCTAPTPTRTPSPTPTPTPTPTQTTTSPVISACQLGLASNQRCCTPDLNPTWWCTAPSNLTGIENACTVKASSGSTTGTLFTCSAPIASPSPSPTPHPSAAPSTTSTLGAIQDSLVQANAANPYTSPTDCVYSARQTLITASQANPTFQLFQTVEDIASTLIPHGSTAAIIGEGLLQTWQTQLSTAVSMGITGWHPIDVAKYHSDFGASSMFPMGITFSGGSVDGHVSMHVWDQNLGGIELDQYSTQAFLATSDLLTLTLNGDLLPGQAVTTAPGLINEVENNLIFQWCNDNWGCPADSYLLDKE